MTATTYGVADKLINRSSRRAAVAEAPKPKCATLLVRISDARDYRDANGNTVTDEEGIKLQIKNGTRHADRIGWVIAKIRVENDVSAFKRKRIALPNGRSELRTVRPEFRATVDDLTTGKSDGLLVSDIDRAMRDPRDLEDLIDVVEGAAPRIPVDAVSGSLRLGNDAEVKMSRVLVAMANGASKDTSRRVQNRREDQAEAGKFGGGPRPYGFGVDTGEVDRYTRRPILDYTAHRPAEAAEIVRSSEAILAGTTSVRELLAEMRNREGGRADLGVSGKPMEPATWRDILCRPRNAGLSVHHGEVLEDVRIEGVDDEHPPIVSVETWRAVCAVLQNPQRRTTPGPAPRWLGSGIYLCGHADCAGKDTTMRVGRGGTHQAFAYLCTGPRVHLARSAEPVDQHVQALMVARLAHPDAAELLIPKVRVDTARLNAEANAIRARIDEAGNLWEAGVFNSIELSARRKRLNAQLAEVTGQLSMAAEVDPLSELAGNPKAAQVWAGYTLVAKRTIMRRVLRVTILPSAGMPRGYKKGSGLPYFNPDSVRIEWVMPATR